MFPKYNVIVVGAGHAGCEAAAAAANMGSRVLLVTMNMQTIAQMSCNPAMGGIAKGQIVREIDALGGYSGIVTDLSTIQFRMLNKSKGPAMWSPRAQNDRQLFASKWREMLENTPNVDFYQDSVNELIIKNNKACGVITSLGHKIESDAVIITSGTFLNGIIHIGEKQIGGGRVAEKSATGITEQLISFGLESDRLKTGTPPRVDGRSLDYSKMEEQKGDEEVVGFSYLDIPRIKAADQRSCYITYTDSIVHDILKTGFDRSPMYQGRIEGVGPRYCPSIEDKINRFADRERHQLFVEPEGWNTVEIYVNGFSTSLPEEVQYEALRKVGQINGTTGYEEAACQGIMAGINAHLKINDKAPLILKRSDAYIGVLIDDLISKGTNEPYRMFTSRAEFRTLLRQDNADLRLTELSHQLGFASAERLHKVEEKTNQVNSIKSLLSNHNILPEEVNEFLSGVDSMTITEKQKASKLLLRPNVSLHQIIENSTALKEILKDKELDHLEQAEIQIKYERYIEKEKEIVERMMTLENKMIPENFDYDKLSALSIEALQKFKKVRPLTIGQASRISGVNPSDIQILMVFIGR